MADKKKRISEVYIIKEEKGYKTGLHVEPGFTSHVGHIEEVLACDFGESISGLLTILDKNISKLDPYYNVGPFRETLSATCDFSPKLMLELKTTGLNEKENITLQRIVSLYNLYIDNFYTKRNMKKYEE